MNCEATRQKRNERRKGWGFRQDTNHASFEGSCLNLGHCGAIHRQRSVFFAVFTHPTLTISAGVCPSVVQEEADKLHVEESDLKEEIEVMTAEAKENEAVLRQETDRTKDLQGQNQELQKELAELQDAIYEARGRL